MNGKAAARSAFEQYVSSEARRLDDFRRTVESRGGPPGSTLDLTRDSLGPLGAWLLEPVPPGPEDAGKPIWAIDRTDDDPYLVGSWLLDGLSTYLAAMLRQRHPTVTWKLEDDRRSIFHGLPVLAGVGAVEFLPYGSTGIMLDRARAAGQRDGDWLVKLLDGWSELAARTAATGVAGAGVTEAELDPELGDVTVESIDGDPDFSAELWISEAAETILGRKAYDGLYDRFAAIPGVERLEWEDRERFLMRLRRGTDLDAVREAARRAIQEARAGARLAR